MIQGNFEVEAVRQFLLPYYLEIKFIHLFFVMMWAWSTGVAYFWFVKSSYLRWQRNPDCPKAKERRDWALEQFDKGVVLEHIAFPIILITGPLLYWLGGWQLSAYWLLIKLILITLIFVPMEAIDYWISHFGGNKTRLRKAGDPERFEKIVQWHWKFFRVTTPFVAIFIPAIIFLAVVKPF